MTGDDFRLLAKLIDKSERSNDDGTWTLNTTRLMDLLNKEADKRDAEDGS